MPIDIDKRTSVTDTTDWRCLAKTYKRGEINPSHKHTRGQLLFAEKGVMLVQTDKDRWVIPPQRALWLPPESVHTFRLLSRTELRTVYFTPAFISDCCGEDALKHVHVIEVTSIVLQLITSLFAQEHNAATRRLMAQLLLRILNETEALPVELPMPQDDKLNRVAQDMLVNNSWNLTLNDFAGLVAMSDRTFSRYFTADTGCTFRTWKQRARIFVSLDLLSNGLSVKQVAYKLGFSCPAAFIAAFRAVTGSTPASFAMRITTALK